jgi:hypothetical protein
MAERTHKFYIRLAAPIFGLCWLAAFPAHAEMPEASTNLYGALGLNTVPSARMDKTGTIRAGISTLDPYAHAWLGVQLAKPLSVVFRQSAEVSSLREDAKALYPGIDFKLRLFEETRARPEISVGLQSAFGHKRTAAEYIALSKRYKDFDFTAGMGWGALGQSGLISNPLFSDSRDNDGPLPNKPKDWFTGEEAGIFGGIEYFTPIDGLSLKLDYSSYRYEAEEAATDFKAPAPWSVGLNYKPKPWIDLGIAAQGTDKIMARISLQGLLQNWRRQDAQHENKTPLRPFRTELSLPSQMEEDAARNKIYVFDAEDKEHIARAKLTLTDRLSAPRQIREAAIHMANNAGAKTEQLEISPIVLGLTGPSVKIMRRDLETANTKKSGSAEEIWHHTTFDTDAKTPGFFTLKRPQEYGYGLNRFSFLLDNQLSLAEDDSGTLYRSSFLVGHQAPGLFGFIDNFASLRINLKNNLDGLLAVRPIPLLPVRGDVALFAERGLALDTLYSAYTHSLRSDLHLSLMGGYLEEMYAGVGGEILYRPFESRFSFGVESWLALKRDPYTFLNSGLYGLKTFTGHVNGWYELPYWDTALHASAGRYLGGDTGGSLGLEKRFENGAKLESYLTVTNQSDADAFGGTTNIMNGVRLTLPLGGFKYAPPNADVRLRVEPLGRENGQRLNNPLPLRDLTEPFTLKHMQDNWSEITQ